MKKSDKDKENTFSSRLKATEPTIWALRRNTSNQNETLSPEETSGKGTLYEHLFGYDPIRVLSPTIDAATSHKDEDIRKGSAENPKLNILNAQTNFLVKDISSSDDGSNA